MALTSTTVFDIVNQTASITFNIPGQVDQISFASNSITFPIITSFNLAKSDMLLYISQLTVFSTLLLTQFPSLQPMLYGAWPLCSFDITESFAGVTHLYYTQTSQGTQVTQINYLPSIAQASVAARVAPVTITVQEFLSMVNFLQQYKNQVNLN